MIVIGRGAPQSSVFRVSRRSGVWSVTRDHAFYGDYLTRGDAVAAASAAACAVETLGGQAQVQSAPSGEVIRHHEVVQHRTGEAKIHASRGRRSAR